MPSNGKHICIPCRNVTIGGTCNLCGEPTKYMGKNWRAPRKTNVKAWQRVAEGQVFWEDTYVARRYVRVPSIFRRSGYGYLTYAAKREHNGSVLDEPVILLEADPRKGRTY